MANVMMDDNEHSIPIVLLSEQHLDYRLWVRIRVSLSSHDGDCSGAECEDSVEVIVAAVTVPTAWRTKILHTVETQGGISDSELYFRLPCGDDLRNNESIMREVFQAVDRMFPEPTGSGYCTESPSGRLHEYDILSIDPIRVMQQNVMNIVNG